MHSCIVLALYLTNDSMAGAGKRIPVADVIRNRLRSATDASHFFEIY